MTLMLLTTLPLFLSCSCSYIPLKRKLQVQLLGKFADEYNIAAEPSQHVCYMPIAM